MKHGKGKRKVKLQPTSLRGYSAEHDAYYSYPTGEWLEQVCGHPDCEFCKDRPKKFDIKKKSV
jgi:hypothetical protein